MIKNEILKTTFLRLGLFLTVVAGLSAITPAKSPEPKPSNVFIADNSSVFQTERYDVSDNQQSRPRLTGFEKRWSELESLLGTNWQWQVEPFTSVFLFPLSINSANHRDESLVGDFSVSATPTSRTVTQGGTATYTITIQSLSGFNSAVGLTALNLPGNQVLPGTGFTPQTVTPASNGSINSTLTIVTNSQTPIGTFTITVRGTSGSTIHDTTITLTVNPSGDFSVSASPSSRTVAQGGTTTYTITVQSLSGFNSPVSLTALNLPGNQVLPGTGFSPQTITPPSNSSTTSTLTIVTNNQTPTGTFTVTVRGTSGTVIRNTTVSITITPPPDFSVSSTPTSRIVTQGGTASYSITIQSLNGFNNAVSLTALNLPGNQVLPGTGFNPQTVTPPSNSSTTSILTIVTNNQTPVGTFNVTVRGTSGSVVRDTIVTITVNQAGDFSISATPTSRTVAQGNSTTYTINLQAIGGFSGTVSLTALNLPGNQVLPGTGFNPATVTLAVNGPDSSTFTIVTNNQTPTGTFTITMRGTSGNLVRDVPISLTVTPPPDFSVSASPTSRTISQGGTATYTIMVQSLNGFNSPVNLTAQNLPGNQVLPGTGFNPQTVTPPSNSSATSTLTIVTNNQTPTGTFTITVRGTSGSLIRDTTVDLTVNQVGDFSVSATPGSRTIAQGDATTYAVNLQGTGGFSGAVSLTALNLPGNQVLPGTGFNPQTVTLAVNGLGSSTLTIITNNQTPTGTFTITIRGTSGSLVRDTTVSLTVTPPPDFTVTATPTSRTITQGESATFTITVQSVNGFNSAVSLTAFNLPGNQVLPGTGFNPQTVTPVANGSVTSTLTIVTNNQTPTGSFTITVRGTGGTLMRETPITLNVNQGAGNFTVSVSPTSRTISQFGSATYGVTVTSNAGFSGTVSLFALNLPGNQVLPGTGFSPQQVTLSPNGTASSTLTIATNNQTPTGLFTVTVRGTGNNLTRETSISLTVNSANPAPSISSVSTPVAINQTTNLIVDGANFQNNFSASVTTPNGTFPIAAAGLTFVSSNQVRVQVTMGGSPPYSATLRITNPDSQFAAGQFQVVSTTNAPPVITSVSPLSVPINQPRILTVQGQNFRQNFTARVQGFDIAQAGLTFVSSNEVLVQVTMGGTPPYQASLVLTNPDGQTATSSFNVSNTPPNTNFPQASFTFSPSIPSVNQPVQFNSTSSGPGLSYSWDFQSDGIIDSTAPNPTFTFNTAGARNVSLQVTNTYGTDIATNPVNVGTTSTAAPVVTNVFRTFPGLYFLKNTNAVNYFDIRVNWNGSPGRVRIQINNSSPVEINGTADGVCQPFNLNTAFTPSWSPTIIKITPINGQGVTGDTSIQTIYVFPYETWLDEAVADLGESIIQRNVINGQSGCSNNFTNASSAASSAGEIKTGIRYSFPPSNINFRVDNVPGVVPLFGGYPLGLSNVKGTFEIFTSSNGNGTLKLQGGGQFTAMGVQLDKLSVSGSGEVKQDYRGLIVRSANFNLGINGKLRQSKGVLTVFPQLSGLPNLPFVGSIFKKFNETAKFYGEVEPNLAVAFNWQHDPADRRLKFTNGTGEIGLGLKGGISVNPINQLSFEGWVGGGGKLTLGVPQPYLREAKLYFEPGIRLKAGPFVKEYLLHYNCKWTNTNPQMNCSSGSLTDGLGISSSKNLKIAEYDYSRFGDYEVFHPKAEETNKIEVKSDSEQLASVSESSLINNLFPQAEPVILPVGNGRMLLWVRQNPNLPALQSTEIAWSYNDGANWSSPSVIVNDTRNEFSPVAGVDGNGKVVAAWLRIKDPAFNINIEDFEQLPLYYKQVEVVSAVFDPATLAWGPETVLTDDLAFDTSLRLASDNNGKMLLTWQSNPSGEFTADSANPAALKYTFWNGTSWNVVGTIANNLVDIGEHSAAVKGNNAFVIVPRDPDANSPNDRLLELYTWNGASWSSATTFAGGNTDNFLPSTVYDSNGQGHVVWLRGADLVQSTLANPTPRTIRQSSESMGFYNARLLTNPQGNLTLVWQEISDNGPANIYAMLYDTASQTWSADLRLNDSDWLSKNASSYYGADGKLRMAYLATQIFRRTITTTIDGETVEIPNVPENGQTDLRLLEHSLINDLSTNDADLSISPQFPRGGESVTATLKLKNAGNFSLNNFNVKLYSGNPSSGGTLINNTRITEQIVAGETRTVNLTFTSPVTQRNIIAVIDADNEINEFSEVNNQAAIYFENTPPVAIATANVLSGTAPLTVNFNASSSYDNDGDAVSFEWSFSDGSPSATGAIVSHTFEQTGLYPVTVSVSDARGAISTATVYVNVNCNAVTISPPTLVNGSTGVSYSQNLSANGGISPYSFVITAGALPAGLTLDLNGQLSGVPTQSGIFNFTVMATYANGCPGSRDYTITINQSNVRYFDFDGDGKTDISIFRPSDGSWWYNRSSSTDFRVYAFGTSSDIITPGDWTGDGLADISVFRPSTGFWFVQRSEDNSYFSFPFGALGDIPAPADYDNDGKTDPAVFRPSSGTWYISNSGGSGTTIIQFGAAGDKPVPADYDGDGKADIAIFRPSDGSWWYLRSSDGSFRVYRFGVGTDKPVQGDWTGDGKADIAVWRPSTGEWFFQRSEDNSYYSVPFGAPGDIPAPGDYDGDGRFDTAVFRPSTADWFVNRTTAGILITHFGANGDRPVPNAFVP
jgi:PKD repeat protein